MGWSILLLWRMARYALAFMFPRGVWHVMGRSLLLLWCMARYVLAFIFNCCVWNVMA
jgi:hypothetical protein